MMGETEVHLVFDSRIKPERGIFLNSNCECRCLDPVIGAQMFNIRDDHQRGTFAFFKATTRDPGKRCTRLVI